MVIAACLYLCIYIQYIQYVFMKTTISVSVSELAVLKSPQKMVRLQTHLRSVARQKFYNFNRNVV